MKYTLFILYFSLFSFVAFSASGAHGFTISGKVTNTNGNTPLAGATVCIDLADNCTTTDAKGNYLLKHLEAGTHKITVLYAGLERIAEEVIITDKDIVKDFPLTVHTTVLDSVSVKAYRQISGSGHLKDVDGTAIYAGKKSEVIVLKNITANTATNNTRQIYYSVAGLNVWENDGGAGIQLSIGGRGLNPNRTSNFNTRQNGYDISADALGYPESYYTPPAEAMERIEVVRGAASLQYGTQFGGIINFKLNHGSDTQKMQIISRETLGSWGFFNTTNSVGGTIKKWNYYAFFQHKSGNGWRPSSRFNSNTGYFSATYKTNEKLSVTAQYTHMDYLEQQPGGLNDLMFTTDPRQATKNRNWFRVNWNLAAILAEYQITHNLKFDTRFFGLLADRSALGIINTVADPGGPRQYREDDYKNWGNESRLLYTYHIKNSPPFTLLGGIRYYSGYTDRHIGDGNDGSGGSKSDFTYDKASLIDSLNYSHYTFPNHNTSLFAENIFRISHKLSIIPGVRYEHIVTKADGFYNSYVQDHAGNVIYNVAVDESRTSKRSFLIAGLGASYTANTAVQLYANISQNYRSINFNDMSIVNPNYRVDPNLQDEKGYSADIGVRGSYKGIVTYDIDVFTINYANRIGNVLMKDTTSPNTYQYTTNVSKSRNYGVESFIEADIWKLVKGSNAKMKLLLFSNFSWINARYVNSQISAYENHRVEFVPDIIFKTGITLRRNRLSSTLQYAYTGQQFTDATNSVAPTNSGINGLVPSYYVMDFSVDYRISRMFSASGTINNLTDHMYYTRRADSYPGPGIIPADGRGFYLTLQVKI
ncbi:TonB-dependent receptor domain-containing protein [Chitinophagaceae bacterium MMS25-I14]